MRMPDATMLLLLSLLMTAAQTLAAAPVISDLPVLAEYPHDDSAFTQGLVYDTSTGTFYESTGLYGRSSVRRVAPSTGEVLASRPLDSSYFGEGLALWNRTLYQLTWRARQGFIYATDNSLTPSGSWTYQTDGWGLTLLPARTVAAVEEDVLLLSDGSSSIYFIDPCLLAERRELRLTVTDAGTPVVALNELEVVEGRLWANMWRTDRIAVIDLASGDVLFYVDCSSLKARLPGTRSVDAVLNGIAYRTADQTLWVTGKLWPTLFEIDLGETLRAHAHLGIDGAAATTATPQPPPSCVPQPQLVETSSPTDRYPTSSTTTPTPERWPWARSDTTSPTPPPADDDAACIRHGQVGDCFQTTVKNATSAASARAKWDEQPSILIMLCVLLSSRYLS